MRLKIYDHNPTKGRQSAVPGVTLSKDKRLYINTAMREKIGIVEGESFQAYLAYDEDTGNIAIGRVGTVKVDENVRWVTFSPRSYYAANVTEFVRQFKIDVKDSPRYVYIEKWNGWYVFRREDLDGPSES